MEDVLHVTVVGDENVGKTYMIRQFLNGINQCVGYEPTVLERCIQIKVEINALRHTLQVWDTAGHDEYSKLRALPYKMTDCFLVCYAVDNIESYQNVQNKWIREIKLHRSKALLFIIAQVPNRYGIFPVREWIGVSFPDATRDILVKLNDILFEELCKLSGTKTDLRNDITKNCYDEECGVKLQKLVKAKKYMECSSFASIGIENIFLEAIREIFRKKNKIKGQCSII